MSSYCARGLGKIFLKYFILKIFLSLLGRILGRTFFTKRAAKHWNRLTTEVLCALLLQEFKRHVAMVLRDILLKGLQQKCHKILQAQSAGSAVLKSKTHRLVLKETLLAKAEDGMLSSVSTSGPCSFFLNYLFCLPVRPGEVLSVLPSVLCRELMKVMHSNSCRESCFSDTHGLLQ